VLLAPSADATFSGNAFIENSTQVALNGTGHAPATSGTSGATTAGSTPRATARGTCPTSRAAGPAS
jgi:nitrous oxidase accessory protein NosD